MQNGGSGSLRRFFSLLIIDNGENYEIIKFIDYKVHDKISICKFDLVDIQKSRLQKDFVFLGSHRYSPGFLRCRQIIEVNR